MSRQEREVKSNGKVLSVASVPLVALAVVGIVVSHSAASAETADAIDSGLSGGPTSRDDWENAMYPYAESVIDAAIASGSYSGEWLDFDTRSLIVRGSGEAPHTVVALIDQAPAGITVSWQSTTFTSEELAAAADEVVASNPHFSVSWGGSADEDFTSVKVFVDAESLEGSSLALIEQHLNETTNTDVPIVVEGIDAVSGMLIE